MGGGQAFSPPSPSFSPFPSPPARPPVDVLEMLVIFLPALEVALFTLVIAVVRDENPHCLGPSSAFALWAAAAFVGMWAVVEVTEAVIHAYVELGLPPIHASMI